MDIVRKRVGGTREHSGVVALGGVGWGSPVDDDLENHDDKHLRERRFPETGPKGNHYCARCKVL